MSKRTNATPGLLSTKLIYELKQLEQGFDDSDDDSLFDNMKTQRHNKRKSPTGPDEELQQAIQQSHPEKKPKHFTFDDAATQCQRVASTSVSASSAAKQGLQTKNRGTTRSPLVAKKLPSATAKKSPPLEPFKKPPPVAAKKLPFTPRFDAHKQWPKAPKPLTMDEREAIIQKIEKPSDKALQCLLYQANFRYSLFPHQFAAVRMVAGLPEDFPLCEGSEIDPTDPMNVSFEAALVGLEMSKTKGCLIGDEMGLGKTVEAVAGAILSRKLARTKDKSYKKPTLIVSPTVSVQLQWRDCLFANGVSKRKITWVDKGMKEEYLNSNNFILITRHAAAAEIRSRVIKPVENGITPLSYLFAHTKPEDLIQVYVELCYASGRTQKRFNARKTIRDKGECHDDAITRLTNLCERRMKKGKKGQAFHSVILDEAHFFKNRATQQTLAVLLACTHAERRVCLTGTPMNNNICDLASIMSLIDNGKATSKSEWWQAIIDEDKSQAAIQKKKQHWHDTYMLRRTKDIIADQLPPKQVFENIISVPAVELEIYIHYESKLVTFLDHFAKLLENDDNDIVARVKRKRLFTILMCTMSLCRSALIAPSLPGYGREATKQFAPSRKDMIKPTDCEKACVCCSQSLRPSIPVCRGEDDKDSKNKDNTKHSSGFFNTVVASEETSSNPHETVVAEEEEEDNNDDDAEELVEKDKRPIFPIPKPLCNAHSGVTHWAHQECLNVLSAQHKFQGGSRAVCPRCLDLERRVSGDPACTNQTLFCAGVVEAYPRGFVGSRKLEETVKWVKEGAEKNEKGLVLSFFKGSLDLVEAILWYEHGISCLRFDGDVSSDEKNRALSMFKNDTDNAYPALLMTVQSGGVGLSITEANRSVFIDRWYNPFVHFQAEDRIHRLGQRKKCDITYLDTGCTIDDVMRNLNVFKSRNSKIILASGAEAGALDAGGLTYNDLSGFIAGMMGGLQGARESFMAANGTNAPIEIDENITSGILQQVLESLSSSSNAGKKLLERKNEG